jgi:hypothetical protein
MLFPTVSEEHETNCVTSKYQVSARYSIIGQLGIAISDPSVATSHLSIIVLLVLK